jgi:AcrR family transcriptional regulator
MNQKEDIIRGSAELFMRYGVKSITMDEIARHLAVSKKTIYQYFADKDELVMEVAKLELHNQKCKWEQAGEECEDIIEYIYKATEIIKNDMGRMNPSLIFDLKKYHPKAFKAFQEHKNVHFLNIVKTSIEKGIKQGLFRKDINVDLIARFRVAQIEMMFDPEIFPYGQFSITDISTQLFDHFIYGISTLKGHQRLDN